MLKSDERERWDPRCAELEWFEEIRFNFKRQKLELCCCGRGCVCGGGGYAKKERRLNFARYQCRAVWGWIWVVSQRQTQLEEKITISVGFFGWRCGLKASFPSWEEVGAPNDVAPASFMASLGIRAAWSTSVWVCGCCPVSPLVTTGAETAASNILLPYRSSLTLRSMLQPQTG